MAGVPLLATAATALVSCSEELPVGLGDAVLPGEPVTVVITIPWSEFGSDLEVFGGYGSPATLGQGVLALQYEGTLDARTLIRFADYPDTVAARDSTGATRPDFDPTYVGGRLVAIFDTAASTNGETAVGMILGRTEVEWDLRTASWDFSVDTINDQQAWPEPGGGPVTVVDTATWDPTFADSVVFFLDSATVAAWSDPTDFAAGARLELLDAGHRVGVRGARLWLHARPSINPDTIVEVPSPSSGATFIYTPNVPPPPAGIRVGGAPSWRTLLDVTVPKVLDSIPELCALVPCPHELRPVEISVAALVLTSAATDPAFQPTDSITVDVRPVFQRSAMPKSPLGESLIEGSGGRVLPPEAFGSSPGQAFEIPFTSYARDLLRGVTSRGDPVPNSLALLSLTEPYSIAYATFEGPGSANEPVLRLIVTIGPAVELP